MKTKNLLTLFLFLLITASPALAGTNEITALLQKGLFEEEANRNLDAAIAAYQSVISQTDKEHQLAATAIFRLAECYRKQNKTNEANTNYQRILHEYADQTDLAKLSRQQLGSQAENSVAKNDSTAPAQTQSDKEAAAKQALDDLESEINNLNGSPEELRVRVQLKYPNPVLNNLMEEMTKEQRTSVLLSSKFGSNNPEVTAQLAVVKSLQLQIGDQVRGIADDLVYRRDKAQKVYDALHNQTNATAVFQLPSITTVAQLAQSQENEEIARITTLIKESPDLINAKFQNSEPPLINAIRANQQKVVKFLLDNHADPEVKGMWGLSALQQAADEGRTEMLTLLLDHGADINAATPTSTGSAETSGFTPLHFAAYRGYKNIAEILLAHGAKINAQDSAGRTPLSVASDKGFKTIAELLLAHGADVALPDRNGNTPFQIATRSSNLAIAKLLLDKHADLNAPNKNGSTPLLNAVISGNKAVFEFLIAEKAEVNPPPDSGTTPLLAAADNGRLDFARVLLEHGADINARVNISPSSHFHWTALHYAISRNPELLAFLLDHQANPNLPADVGGPDSSGVVSGVTPLMMAAMYDQTNSTEILLAHGATLEARDKDGSTPLRLAVNYRQPDLVELLLTHNADVNTRDQNGSTPLTMAAMLNSTPIAEILLAHHADVNARNNDGLAPLHIAADNGYKAFTELLLAHGADVNIKNNPGVTPLDLRLLRLTRQNGNQMSPAFDSDEIVVLLRQHGGFTEMERGTIRVTGQDQQTPYPIFYRDFKGMNQFTLLETIANTYSSGMSSGSYSEASLSLQFPDFSHVKIRRVQPDGSTNILNVDLDALFNSGDCSRDILMQWGDIVEIPALDHKVSEKWPGLSDTVRKTLTHCLERRVKVIVKGQTTEVTITPGPYSPYFTLSKPGEPHNQTNQIGSPTDPVPPFSSPTNFNSNSNVSAFSFWLYNLIQNVNLILASSDLTHIKITRLDPTTHKPIEFTSRLEGSLIWLREGDTIEIPEKP